MVLPFIIWTVTGLLFHLKPGWPRAYEMLSVEVGDTPLPLAELASRERVIAALPAVSPNVHRVELVQTSIGPLYRVAYRDKRRRMTALVDARSARLLSPLAPETAAALVASAVERSPHRAAYGRVASQKVEANRVIVRFDGGPTVTIGRNTARLRQRGPDTDRIDWYYRVHYVRWTGYASVDRALAMVVIVGTWVLSILGVWLFVRRRREQGEA